jgi:hypothetical protein
MTTAAIRNNSPLAIREGIEEALLRRLDHRAPISENGKRFAGFSLCEMGRELIESAGVDARGRSRMEISDLMLRLQSRDAGGMQSTSDFVNLLANVANKRLRQGYEQNPGSFKRWARRAADAADFKPISVVQLSAMPDLLKVNEAGEIKYGAALDGAEGYSLLSYGRMIALTRQAMVNDDLRAFDRALQGFAAAAARLENRTAYAQLTGNANLSDGVALFATGHGNNGTGAGSALQFSALTTARTAMRTQKGLQSEELNLAPSFLIGPAALEQTMYQLTSTQYVPTKTTDINEFMASGRTALEPVVEPILDATNAATWYLAASNSQIDTVEYAYLEGADAPRVETKAGFEVDGVMVRCLHDFGVKAIDYRGLYRGVGA